MLTGLDLVCSLVRSFVHVVVEVLVGRVNIVVGTRRHAGEKGAGEQASPGRIQVTPLPRP